MKVKVYFNLHKHLFSVVAMEGPDKGRVIAHERELVLTGCRFKVYEPGRQRVLREKRKNVHAFVFGNWIKGYPWFPRVGNVSPVTYNPYKYSSFVKAADATPVWGASAALLSGRSILALDPK